MSRVGALQKYDVVSAGVGALTVTSYCVWRGQDPWTALSITFAATVAALVSKQHHPAEVCLVALKLCKLSYSHAKYVCRSSTSAFLTPAKTASKAASSLRPNFVELHLRSMGAALAITQTVTIICQKCGPELTAMDS